MTQEINIVTDNWTLRSAPPARLGGDDYLLKCHDPNLHVTFDAVAGPSEVSSNITFHRRGGGVGDGIATISAASLPGEIVTALTDVPEYGELED